MLTKLATDFLRPFSPEQISFILSVAMEMETYGLAADEVADACRGHLLEISKKMGAGPKVIKSQRMRPPSCPNCKAPLSVLPVNVSPSTNVGDNWTYSLLCRRCHFDELTDKQLSELVK